MSHAYVPRWLRDDWGHLLRVIYVSRNGTTIVARDEIGEWAVAEYQGGATAWTTISFGRSARDTALHHAGAR